MQGVLSIRLAVQFLGQGLPPHLAGLMMYATHSALFLQAGRVVESQLMEVSSSQARHYSCNAQAHSYWRCCIP